MTIEADSATIRQALNDSFSRVDTREELQSAAKNNLLLAKKLYTSSDLWIWWINLLDDKIMDIMKQRATSPSMGERESNMLDGKLFQLLELQQLIKTTITKAERIQEQELKKEQEQNEAKTEI